MKVAQRYVCVRVTDLRGIDLDRHRFDFDLTFCALLMHPDGTVYHRFGGRDHESATSWISMDALVRLMQGTLEEHAAHVARPPQTAPEPHPPRTIADYPTFARRDQEKRVDCVHCHMVYENAYRSSVEAGTWARKQIWRWPPPQQVGLTLDAMDQDRVRGVDDGSPAAAAGLRPDDRLLLLGKQRIRSITDVQAVLDELPWEGGTLPAVFLRGEAEHQANLVLSPGWREGTPLTFSWRASKWPLSPAPGFGGKDLDANEKERLGLPAGGYAFRITYLVTWGSRADLGRNAQKAGLRKGDVVYSVAGRTDFRSQDHFHAWFRLRCRAGQTVEILHIRDGRRLRTRLPVIE